MNARPPHVTVQASGDTVGNNALITVGHHSDGSTSIVIENHRTTQTAWLLPHQAVELAAALLRIGCVAPPCFVHGGDQVRTLRQPKPCQIDGCHREARIRGVCGPHDYRILVHGDPHYTGPDPHAVRRPRGDRRPQVRKVCSEFGCDLLVFSGGRCQAHFVTAYLDSIPAGCYA